MQSSKPISDNDQDTQKTVVPLESGQKMPWNNWICQFYAKANFQLWPELPQKLLPIKSGLKWHKSMVKQWHENNQICLISDQETPNIYVYWKWLLIKFSAFSPIGVYDAVIQ